jgi:hypothetical protein
VDASPETVVGLHAQSRSVRLIVKWLARYGSLLDENGGMDYPNFYKAIIMEMVKPHARGDTSSNRQ